MGEFGGLIGGIMLTAKANGLYWPLVVVCAAIAVLILWLAFRKARLWYWRVNQQVNALENIDLKLQKIEQGLKSRGEKETKPEKARASEPRAEEKIETRTPEKERSWRGKSGRIYTEAELEALIRE